MIKTLLLIFGLGLALETQAAQPVFRVSRKQGKIFVKGPTELAWHPLRTRILPLGTLLRVDPLSTIELTMQSDAVQNDDVLEKIRISQPLITRLDEDLVRRSQVEDYPLKSLWDEGAEASKANKDFPMLSFASAFVRSIMTLDRVPKIPEVNYKEDPAGVEVGGNMLPIKMLSPGPESLYFLSNGNASIPVIWEAPANGLKYRLYVWEEKEARSRPVASIPDVWFQLELDKTGKYKIQVEDETHKYRSPAITITVDRPLPSMTAEEKNTGESHLADILLISPYPRATQVVKNAKAPYLQSFAWEDKVGLEKNEFYRLLITKKVAKGGEKEKIKKVKTTALSAQVSLDPGTYTWVVQKMSSERQKNVKSSDPRKLDIRASTATLSTILHEAPSQSIYFDLK